MLDIVILPHFFHLKNILPVNTFTGFPRFRVINIIQFHFRWNIIYFIWEERKLKKFESK